MAQSVEDEIRELCSLFRSERDPDGCVFAPLADAYRRAGDLDRADELLTEGLASRSDFVPAHVVSGWVRRDQGDVAGAVRAFRAALALDAKNTEARAGLAELGEEPRSETPVTPEDKGPVTRTLAELYASQALYERALGVYRRLLEREPGDAALRERMNELQSLSAKGTAAEADAEEAQAPDGGGAEGPGERRARLAALARTPASAAGPERSAGPSAREYLQGLLSWASCAQSPAEAEARVEPEGLDAAESEAAQPGSGSAAARVSRPTAPAVRPAFAPDAVPIASTAPQVVGIAALAPDPDDAALRGRVSELESVGGMAVGASGPEPSAGESAPLPSEGPLAWEFDEPTAEFAGPAPGEAPARAALASAFAPAPVPIASLAPDAPDVAASAPDPSRAADARALDGRAARR